MMNAQELPSTRPYLIRALYEWCADNGYTPYLVVRVNESVQVPREYVNNGEIVLNVSYDAILAGGAGWLSTSQYRPSWRTASMNCTKSTGLRTYPLAPKS